jgi:type VI secretion system secreted protein VgrG
MPIAELTFESAEASLSVRSFRVDEAVSKPFAITVMARSPSQIDLESIVGRAASLQLTSGVAHLTSATRRWTGICHHIEQVQAEPTGLSTYELAIMPSLWLLSQRRGHRVYQHLSIPDIAVRKENGYGHQFAMFGGSGGLSGSTYVSFLREFLQGSDF